MGRVAVRSRSNVLPFGRSEQATDRTIVISPSRSPPIPVLVSAPQVRNRLVIRSRDEAPPIGRVGSGGHSIAMPLQRFTRYITSLGIPNSIRVVTSSRDDVPPIERVQSISTVALVLTCVAVERAPSVKLGSASVPVGVRVYD